MGQARSRDVVYAAPEMSSNQPVRKAGSLTSLTLGKRGRKGSSSTLKRSRSLKDNREMQEELLRERIEQEAKELDKWVSERQKKYREQVVPRLEDLAAVKVAKSLQAPTDVEGLPVTRELKDAVEFRLSPSFDQTIADEKVAFSNRGRTIRYTGKGYSTTAMQTPFGRGLRRSRHAWIVHVDNSRVQGWIQIGVVNQQRKDENCRTKWDGHPHPFRAGEMARRNNGNFHSGRNELEATMVQETIFLGGFTTGDTISLKVDFDMKQLQWLKNGEDYGGRVPFEEDVLHPSVSLDSPGEAVTLVYYTGPIAI